MIFISTKSKLSPKEMNALFEMKIGVDQIAYLAGVSEQCVREKLKSYTTGHNLPDSQIRQIEKIKYPNIRKYLIEKNLSIHRFYNTLHISYTYITFKLFLIGENQGNMECITAILKETGLTFEQAFGE